MSYLRRAEPVIHKSLTVECIVANTGSIVNVKPWACQVSFELHQAFKKGLRLTHHHTGVVSILILVSKMPPIQPKMQDRVLVFTLHRNNNNTCHSLPDPYWACAALNRDEKEAGRRSFSIFVHVTANISQPYRATFAVYSCLMYKIIIMIRILY